MCYLRIFVAQSLPHQKSILGVSIIRVSARNDEIEIENIIWKYFSFLIGTLTFIMDTEKFIDSST